MHAHDEDCVNPHSGIKMHGSVVVGTKWQVVIPSDVRRMLSINPGDSMCVVTKHGKALAMIKMDDLEEFMKYLQAEMDAIKGMALEERQKQEKIAH